MVLSKGLVSNNIDICLGELAVAALLRTFATPHFLNLLATDREEKKYGILQYL